MIDYKPLEDKEQCKKCLHYQVCANVMKNQLHIREKLLKEKAECEHFVSVTDGDEYISKLKISGYIGGVFTQVMTSGINAKDLPFTLSPSAYLSGYKDGLKKALSIVQNFEADVVIKAGDEK